MQASLPRKRPHAVTKAFPQGELALIDSIRARSSAQRPARSRLVLGIGDDCAILRPRRGEDLVVTTDFCLEGRHFRRDWHTAASAGHRTLARGLSDLAAMGSRPLAIFLSLALPRRPFSDGAWVEQFLDGLLALAKKTGVPLAGGDTAEAPGEQVLADIVCLGAVPRGRALRRDGARPGDRLFVTGSLGGAAAELDALSQRSAHRRKAPPAAAGPGGHPQLFPEPRLASGQALVRRQLATAAIDISDGLSTDLLHLCEASGLAAEIDQTRLPLHSLLAREDPATALAHALHGGEDYELLFTVAAGARVPRQLGGIALTEIGKVVPHQPRRSRLIFVAADGRRQPLRAGGWEHLR